jgi:hypothetical protein
VGKPEEEVPLGDLNIYGRIILKYDHREIGSDLLDWIKMRGI